MQKESKILDDLARMASGAASSALDIKREIEAAVAAGLGKLSGGVSREEFETVRRMAANAREENENLRRRLQILEESIGNNNP